MRREALVRFDGGSPGQRTCFKDTETNRAFYPMELPPDERGRRGNASSRGGGRGGAKRVRIPPAGRALRRARNAAGVGTSDLGDETDRADLEARGPPERKRRP